VIFGGGSTAGVLDDTWIGTKSKKGVRWRKLDLDLNPGPRYGFSFAHDEKNGLLIVCGGQIPCVPRYAWIPTRASSFGVVDPKRSRALMGFGNIGAGPFLDLVEVKLRQ